MKGAPTVDNNYFGELFRIFKVPITCDIGFILYDTYKSIYQTTVKALYIFKFRFA